MKVLEGEVSSTLIEDLLGHLSAISRTFTLNDERVIAHIAGWAAVNYHTSKRTPGQIEIDWSHRVFISPDRQSFMTQNPDGHPIQVHVVAGIPPSLGLFHPDWKAASLPIFGCQTLIVKVISPLDLVVSRIGRFAEHDREDIRFLVQSCDVSTDDVARRAKEALDTYIADDECVKGSIARTIDLIDEVRR